jgi:hyperosmotically inducible periplasmic protein
MNNRRWAITRIASAALLLAFCASAQEHKWAGRTLDGLEQSIHDRLAALPYHGVFDTVNFELQGKTVVLTGFVVKDTFPERAVRALKQIDGVEQVVNHLEVLPSSRRDDVLRKNIYQAVFEDGSGPGEGAYAGSAIHIVVKNGFVTLEGVVNSDAARNDIQVKTMRVVPHVVNNLRVSPDSGTR